MNLQQPLEGLVAEKHPKPRKNHLALTALKEADRKRFWSKVRRSHPKECWEWQGTKNNKGYGNLWLNDRPVLAHRISFFLSQENFNQTLIVCHHCDNPSCVNPAHLFVGTDADNARDMTEKGRNFLPNPSLPFCPNGHFYNPQNTYFRPDGGRRCKICHAAREKMRKRKLKRNY